MRACVRACAPVCLAAAAAGLQAHNWALAEARPLVSHSSSLRRACTPSSIKKILRSDAPANERL